MPHGASLANFASRGSKTSQNAAEPSRVLQPWKQTRCAGEATAAALDPSPFRGPRSGCSSHGLVLCQRLRSRVLRTPLTSYRSVVLLRYLWNVRGSRYVSAARTSALPPPGHSSRYRVLRSSCGGFAPWGPSAPHGMAGAAELALGASAAQLCGIGAQKLKVGLDRHAPWLPWLLLT